MDSRWFPIWLGVCTAALLAGPAAAQPAGPRVPPGPVIGLPVRDTAVSDPAAGHPLPTDGLMAPPPAVPPRRSYQRPAPAPEGPPPEGPPPPPEPPDFTLPEGTYIPVPQGGVQEFGHTQRYGRGIDIRSEKLPDGTTRWVVTGGVIFNVRYAGGQQIEFATDDAVVWTRGAGADKALAGFQNTPDQKTEVELFLSGNVIIRMTGSGQGGPVTQTLRADQIYYDAAHHRAIALAADLELAVPRLPDGVHLAGQEVRRLDLENWEILGGTAHASKLPADPGLRLDTPRATLRERRVIRRNIFGIPYRDLRTGEPVEGWERIVTTQNVVTRVEGVPVFYLPYLKFDATDPLGPFVGLGLGQDRIFGTQIYTTWDMYKLLALRPPPGHRWRLHGDFLSDRGPAGGTEYSYLVPPPEGGWSPTQGLVRLYALSDGGVDVLGGIRGPEPVHPAVRGRALWRHQQEVIEGMYFQGQFAYLSDKNFLEQFFKNEFDFGPNQETFAHLTYQGGNRWSSGLLMPKVGREWESQTQWLPRLDGAVVGQSFWDLFVYDARVSAAYAMARPSEVNPFPILPTDRRIDTGRFDLGQELSLPFALGPVKLAPYGVLDLAYYTRDLTGDDRGRAYGGGGLRGSLPFSRLYEGAASELFNVRGLYHKVVLGANYYYARSDTPYTRLPLLDRLNDDAVDRAYRNIRPFQTLFVPGPAGQALAFSPLFDQQRYAIRRLVDNRVDTLDDVQVLQGEVRQRFQTKRGYPGLEHTVDLFSLDVSASYFPEAERDNFGKPFAFLEYAALWNVGDRVAVQSSGWFDPFDFGARFYNVGVALDRPDGTSFSLTYRQTDPLNSKAVTASVGYQLSKRYYTNLGASYDFGMQRALTNTFSLTRTGSDLTVTFGVSYNALVNNFGVQFLIVPNVIAYAAPGRFGGLGGSQLLGR